MVSPDDSNSQQQLLQIHRRTLYHLLNQEAMIGKANVPPSIFNGIAEARANIWRIKETLRSWSVAVEDLPEDVVDSENEQILKSMISGDLKTAPATISGSITTGDIFGLSNSVINVSSTSVLGFSDDDALVLGGNYIEEETKRTQAEDEQEQQFLRDLLRTQQNRLRVLELQYAAKGNNSPAEIVTEIAEYQRKIAETTAKLGVVSIIKDQGQLRTIRSRALKAYYSKRWAEAERLLAQTLSTDLTDQDIEAKLREVQGRLNSDVLYATIAEFRTEDNWEAALIAIDDWQRQYPKALDVDELRSWAEQCQKLALILVDVQQSHTRNDWQKVRALLEGVDDKLFDNVTREVWAWADTQHQLEYLYKQAGLALTARDWKSSIQKLDTRTALDPLVPDPQEYRTQAEQLKQQFEIATQVVEGVHTLVELSSDQRSEELLRLAQAILQDLQPVTTEQLAYQLSKARQ